MRAALFDAYRGPLDVREVPDPPVPGDGVVVQVAACGVCRSDWHGWTGADPDVSPPHVPGHELAGTVVAVGADCRRFRPGDRVTAPFILGCGHCPDCRAGDPTVCRDQYVVGFSGWGAFAERVAVPRADFNLIALPESLDFAAAAGMGCRVTTAFRGIVDRAALMPGEWLAVHGCGGVGLSAVMIGTALGAAVLAVDIAQEKLELARALGASATLEASAAGDVGQAIRDLTGGGAHVSVDALGITASFHNSLSGLRRRGRHVQIGMPTEHHAAPTIPLLDLVYARQLTLHGTRGMPAHRFPALFRMVAAGRIDPGHLVTRRIALTEAGASLAAMDHFAGAGVTVIDRF
jgi:alcohol dehydrogenase